MPGRRQLLVVLAIAVPLWMVVLVATSTTEPSRAAVPEPLSPIEALGKAIFFDTALSIERNQSCATCHDPAWGWTGPDSAINTGGAVYEGSIPGRFGDRKPPSAAYATQAAILHMPEPGFFVGGTFWDGRATGERLGSPTAEQAQGPFLNPVEQALPDAACVVERVVHASYPVSFTSVWGNAITSVAWPSDVDTVCAMEGGVVALDDADRAKVGLAYDQIAYSIDAYEASSEVNAFSSKFDAWRAGTAKLTKMEKQGKALFQGKGKCDLCHLSNGQQPLFTDYTYDNLGIPANPDNPVYDTNPSFVDLGLGAFLASRPDYDDFAEENEGKFKVPTLRNVDLRPGAGSVKAYGHNGYFKTLQAIVHFYNTRDVLPTCGPGLVEGVTCWPEPEYPENVNDDELGDLRLSARQEAKIVAFLKTLSDGFVG